MTLPARAPLRKPRRLGLYGPFVVLLVLAAVWSAGWLWLRAETIRRMDGARRSMIDGGQGLDWASRSVSGFPFRLDVDLTDARVGEASGWAVTAPRLQAEAPAFAPTRWVVVAPGGVVVQRPAGGAVIVTAKVLRASISDVGARPPRLSVEGIGLTFAAAPGAAPFFMTAAEAFHFHTRAGPGDRGAAFIELDEAKVPLSGLMGRIAAGKPLNLLAEAVYSHAGALTGADWASAVRAWRRAGGALNIQRLRLAAGRAVVDARSGTLSVDDEGRLRGSLTASLQAAPRALGVLSQGGALPPEAAGAAAQVVGAGSAGALATVTLDFQAGETTLGPAAIGPAPKVY
jgi:hypothetical protein